MPLTLSELLDEKQIILDLRAREAGAAVGEIVAQLRKHPDVVDASELSRSLTDPDRVRATTAENGVAFPHVRTDSVKNIVLAIGRSQAGVQFEDGAEPAHLLFVIGTPKQMVNDYLLCVGALARLAKDDAVRERLLQAETAGEFIAALTGR